MSLLTRLPWLAEQISFFYGIEFGASATPEPDSLWIFPRDLDRTNGFRIRVSYGWRSLQISFEPGTFAAALIEAMGRAAGDQRLAFGQLARVIALHGGRLEFSVNGSACDPLSPETWPAHFRKLQLTCERIPFSVGEDDAAIVWIKRMTSMVMALIPVEEIEQVPDAYGLAEGSVSKVLTNRYERNPVNRAVCIETHGTTCCVCGLNLEEVYGPIAAGFIHVHHVIPVSKLGPDYVIDPAKDLVPVCPNCHAMLHRRPSPLSVDELKEALKTRGS